MNASMGKRVLMLIENSTYPLDIRVRYEAGALISAGYQVSVICQRGVGQPWRDELNGVYVYRYPAPVQGQGFLSYVLEYIYSFAAAFLLSFVVWAERGFDIIHTANPPDTAVFMAIFYRLFGKLFMFDHHDLTPDMYLVRTDNKGNRLAYRLLCWMEKVSFRFAHHVISTNQSYKRIAIERGHVSQEHVTIVRNGPMLEKFEITQSNPELKKMGRIILGYVGVMGPQDGVDYLLRALNYLKTTLSRNDFFCVIIGQGSALADLKNQSRQLGLDQYVRFTGFIPHTDALRHLSTVDICVDPDPSNIYNDRCTMIKVMEYMALGKPIVAFDLPEHRVSAGDAALYARPNEELDFARQILVLMDDHQLRMKMGQVGRKRIEDELAWSYQAKYLLDAYASISATT